MQVVDREHAVGQPRAGAFLEHQHPCAKRARAAAELVAIQLGHRIMHVQDHARAEELQRERA